MKPSRLRATVLHRRGGLFHLTGTFEETPLSKIPMAGQTATSNAKYRSPASRYEEAGLSIKLGGLVLMIEGVGRTKLDGKLHALGLISFDDASDRYRMRAYNDGRWLETDVTLLEDGLA